MATTDPQSHEASINLHLEEAELIKKQWFSYVFQTLDRLHEQVKENSDKAQRERELLHKELVTLKENLMVELRNNSELSDKEVDKLEERLAKAIDDLEGQLSEFCRGDFKELRDEVADLRIKVEGMSGKQTAYVAMTTIGVTTVLSVLASGILIIFKDSIVAWLGV